ncbi:MULTISPECIES: siderophore-interacting protein [Pandoraea]|uniref:FAD-binding protein n=1 Tax=Pandoraea pnomenusa TaxID=93220 RepID=A0A378YXZ2_9BURK|nr:MULTISPECIES: siderophore-interacting protein [Pandoraea]AHB06837.1 FAD-binding protein [Pandoraea pnomenusa 3kgm]AHB77045.1 NADPH-dependent ferric siderophore reductase [Pandoraea pnomenusa]AHN74589.1 NADPH-dependent ferric siderophore reductase [Pandoraea pnomenusa]AIU28854.1 FAD-binding protein [Pandoraea pnomenusa]SUA81437.1 NADPH-dependent ferric-chelate reductase [Pandoraea pnomenusa]
MQDNAAPNAIPDRTPQRVRHELRMRLLEVRDVEALTPNMRRVTLGGDDLEGFESPGFDDHVKLFFPDPQTGELVLPRVGPEGVAKPAPGDAPRLMRDYTPRRFDAATRTLVIDFALHDSGPATEWARSAKPGDRIGVGGPRGSFIIPMNFEGYLLIGDDTALPAISRRLAELPAGSLVFVFVEVDSPADRLRFASDADVVVEWIYREGIPAGQSTALLDALQVATLPDGDLHAWVAAEAGVAKAIRRYLVDERGLNPKWVKAAAYWRRGDAAVHENLDD